MVAGISRYDPQEESYLHLATGGCLRSRLWKRVALVASAAVALAACSSGTTTSTPGDPFDPVYFHPRWLAANVNATGSPVTGGTLKLEGSTDVSAALDPQGEYETIGFTVERAFTRQLVSFPASARLTTAESIVPDAATPTVSHDGLTYTFRIKSGVMWNTPTPRQVTSQDFKRGIERNCDPTLASQPSYYTATIAGFASFCTPFESMDPKSSAAARAAYINGHDVSGIQTPDSATIVFSLTQPATDFLSILALPFASAAPIEDLSYVPLTPGNPFFSDGPYQVSKYVIGHEITLDHNPQWSQSTDTIRHDYVSNIAITLDLAGSAVASLVQNDLTTGAADLEWDTTVPIEDVAALTSPASNPQFGAFPAPGDTNPYLVFNVQSPNNNGELANVKVRQALEYAIDKTAINKIYGGSQLNEPLNQVIGPGAEGYVPFNDYPTPNNQGDPAKCKSLLKAAGYPNGITLKDLYRTNGNHTAVFHEVQSDFGKCGVTVVGTPISAGYYGLSGIGVTSANGLKSGTWDITEPGYGPDWFGPTNGRALLAQQFEGSISFPGQDWGGYDDPAVDALVNNAESARTLSQSASYWHQADEQVMADAAFIPFQTQLTLLFRSGRVHNAIYFPLGQQYDITQVWLSQ
jgi:ABC-type transport system substrate-binding protein